jgi:hypothetical protein
MKLRALLAALVAFACAEGACSLNPQPLPPDQYDAATTGSPDASKGNDSGTTFGDGGVPTNEDAGSDAGEDASDASTDANDAATTDAADDASDAVADALGD